MTFKYFLVSIKHIRHDLQIGQEKCVYTQHENEIELNDVIL